MNAIGYLGGGSQETLVMEWESVTRKGERAAQDVLSGMFQAGLLEHNPAGKL